MKKLVMLMIGILFLSGCSMQNTMETISDSVDVQVVAPVKELKIDLPAEAGTPTLLANDGSKFYECDGYTLCVQTLESGDLTRSLKEITGFDKENLMVMERELGGIKQYDCVWSAAGENGDYVGRALIIDDGNYHYTVTVMAEFEQAGTMSEQWKKLFNSVRISDID